MSRHWWCVALLLLAGCGEKGHRVDVELSRAFQGEQATSGVPATDLTAAIDLEASKLEPTLTELLQQPRKDLAALCDEELQTIQYRSKGLEGQDDTIGPLGMLRPVLTVPIFSQAKYYGSVGFSLPPYLTAGRPANAVALHLARHGDTEAARRLVEPADKETLARIDALALPKNVPLEWTRLVALRLHAAVLRLALNDLEGGKDLVALHRQLREALGEKGAAGPLGAALLGRGRKAMQVAAVTWQECKRPDLAGQAERILKAWGDIPAPSPGIEMGQRWADALRALDGKEQGRIARPNVRRALDLLAVPLPENGAEAVLAFRDGDRLGELLVLYRTGPGKAYRDPAHLALTLEEAVAPNPDDDKQPAGALLRRSYSLGKTVFDVTLVPRSGLVSGWVRVTAGATLAVPSLQRDFGTVHLGRSFDQNRAQLAPAQRGDGVSTTQDTVLDRIGNPLRPAALSRVEMRREPGHTATAGLTFRYARSELAPPLAELAAPAWAAWGPCRFEPADDPHGGHLGLVWTDARTRAVLRLPVTATEPVTLDIQDQRPDQVRDPGALEFDRDERKARLAAGKPIARLLRGVDPIAVRLGMSRDQAMQSLPGGRGVYTREIPDGFMTTLIGDPTGVVNVPRQVFVRLGRDGKVGELRVRFQDVAMPGRTRGTKELLDGLVKQYGVWVESPGSWATLWPERKSMLHTWRDDLTLLTCQTEAAGAELTVRDWVEQPDSVSVAPLEYLPRGPKWCSLGETRDELLKRWDVADPVTARDGALILKAPPGSTFDLLLVYFADGKVDRVVARRTQEKPLPSQPAQMGTVLSDVWGSELRNLGWPRWQDAGPNGALQALWFHDERTVVKLFWQDDSNGKPSVYTEWRAVPR